MSIMGTQYVLNANMRFSRTLVCVVFGSGFEYCIYSMCYFSLLKHK